MSTATVPSNTSFSAARRLRAIQDRATDPEVTALTDEVCAIEDRVLYLEAAVAHLCALLQLDPHRLPAPPRLHLHIGSTDAEGV